MNGRDLALLSAAGLAGLAAVQHARGSRATRLTRAEFEDAPRTFWHATQYGKLLPQPEVQTSGQGFHVGSYEAARQALQARSGWDVGPHGNPREVARNYLRKWQGMEIQNKDGSFTYTSHALMTGDVSVTLRFEDSWIRVLAYHQERSNFGASYFLREAANSSWLGLDWPGMEGEILPHALDDRPRWLGAGDPRGPRGAIFPVWITGPMTGDSRHPREDFATNGRMRGLIRRGMARRGVYYRNIGEDEGSISAALPDRSFVKTYEELFGVEGSRARTAEAKRLLGVRR